VGLAERKSIQVVPDLNLTLPLECQTESAVLDGNRFLDDRGQSPCATETWSGLCAGSKSKLMSAETFLATTVQASFNSKAALRFGNKVAVIYE
jgi:hypothetical protein